MSRDATERHTAADDQPNRRITLQTAYTQADELTVLAVVSEPTKLRDAKAKEAAG